MSKGCRCGARVRLWITPAFLNSEKFNFIMKDAQKFVHLCFLARAQNGDFALGQDLCPLSALCKNYLLSTNKR